MTFSANRYNKKRLFEIDTTDFEYYSLEEYFKRSGGDLETVTEINGLYINKMGLYNDSPIIATSECYINLPAHLNGVCQEMLNDPLAITAIKSGKLGFKIIPYYKKKFNKECYTVEWVDI